MTIYCGYLLFAQRYMCMDDCVKSAIPEAGMEIHPAMVEGEKPGLSLDPRVCNESRFYAEKHRFGLAVEPLEYNEKMISGIFLMCSAEG